VYEHSDFFRMANSEMATAIQTNMTLSQITTCISEFGEDLGEVHQPRLIGWKNYVPWKKALEEGGYVLPDGTIAP